MRKVEKKELALILNNKEFKFFEVTRIGKGGFGEVFLYLLDGVEAESHQFAVKFIDFNKAKSNEEHRASLMKGILAENFILTKLKHENIVKGYFYHLAKANHTDPFCHFMEFCNGGTLEKLLNRKKKEGKYLEEKEILAIFTDILKGMQYVQFLFKQKQKHIMHRDLKPDNFFFHITKEGRRIVKVGDFGLSKVYFNQTNPIVPRLFLINY